MGLDAKDFINTREKIVYHASCRLCRGLGVKEAPRALIKTVDEYASCAKEETCRGFAGTYSMKIPEIAAALMENKLNNAEAAGATRPAVDCPRVMQLRGGGEAERPIAGRPHRRAVG